MPLPNPSLATLLAIALAIAGCATALPGGPAGKSPARKPGAATATGRALPATAAVAAVARAPGTVTLTGKAKLLSDMGAGLIANNGGGLISDHGGGVISNQGGTIISNNAGALISNNGGGVIANNGAGIVGKTKYGLTQAAGGTPQAAAGATPAPRPAEFALADAEITFLDATGEPLRDAKGQPVRTTTDRTGAYKLDVALPKRNLVMRIKLWNGGELSAILTPEAVAGGKADTREVAIDTASTLGATYVLSKFVASQPDPQQTYDKLPAAEAERLRLALDAAREHLTAAPRYEANALVTLADELRTKAPAVDQTLKDIEVLLLGGFGDGKAATQVALSRPRALALLPGGELVIGEQDFGRLRRVARDGTITNWVDGVGGVVKTNFAGLIDVDVLPDGGLLIASERLNQVFRLGADGVHKPIAGSGANPEDLPGEVEPVAGAALATPIAPCALAVAPGGAFWIGQDHGCRIFRVEPDGACAPLPRPTGWDAATHLGGLATGPDGALYVLGRRLKNGEVARLGADGGWTIVATGLALDEGDLAVAPDGTLYVCEDREGRLTRIAPDGTRTPLAGPGAPADAPKVVAPAGLLLAPDGTLYMADQRTNQVFARDAAGAWRHVAGAAEGLQQGDDLAINAPSGIAFDGAGQLLLTEGAGHTVKRWDGKSLATLAGSARGDEGDGGPAADARFDTPWSVLARGEEILVMDSRNARIRAIAPDGRVRTLVGVPGETHGKRLKAGEAVPADQYPVERGAYMALGPDGMLYWSSISLHQIVRLRPDGKVELVAGKAYAEDDKPEDGEDGPAAEAGLASPMGLAFAPNDPTTLYFADVTNMRVRKVVGVGTPAARVETVAGLGRGGTLMAVLGLTPGWELQPSLPARESFIVGPSALAFDEAGALYVAEVGTENLNQLGGGTDAAATLGSGFANLPPIKSRIRRLTADGRLETIVGLGGKALADPAEPNPIGMPTGIAFDKQGRLVFVDVRANAIRFVPRKGW